jgi:hypothetical protein
MLIISGRHGACSVDEIPDGVEVHAFATEDDVSQREPPIQTRSDKPGPEPQRSHAGSLGLVT